MSIDITQELLNEVTEFVETRLTNIMMNEEVSINAMMFILQSILDTIEKMQDELNKREEK